MLFLFVCFLGFLLPNRTKTVSRTSVPIALISSLSLSFFIQERWRLNREPKTKQEQTCPLVEFASLPEPSPLPATANKGHLGQLVHLAQLHSARASLWRVPSFQSINIVLARYSYYFCLTGTKNSIFTEFWVWALSSPYFHISSYVGLLPFRLTWLWLRRRNFMRCNRSRRDKSRTKTKWLKTSIESRSLFSSAFFHSKKELN